MDTPSLIAAKILCKSFEFCDACNELAGAKHTCSRDFWTYNVTKFFFPSWDFFVQDCDTIKIILDQVINLEPHFDKYDFVDKYDIV